jgi:Ca2+/H+ antiporter
MRYLGVISIMTLLLGCLGCLGGNTSEKTAYITVSILIIGFLMLFISIIAWAVPHALKNKAKKRKREEDAVNSF